MTTTPAPETDGARALVVGESLIDVVRRRDGSVDEHPGGSPMNVAISLGRLGRQVELLTWFGQDTRGAALREHLAESAVRVVEGSDGAASTSVAVATLDATGAATYTQGRRPSATAVTTPARARTSRPRTRRRRLVARRVEAR